MKICNPQRIGSVLLFAAAIILSCSTAWSSTNGFAESVLLIIEPPLPILDDTIELTVSGEWHNGCTPNNSRIRIEGNNIYFDILHAYPPDTICTMALAGWSMTESLGTLEAGRYEVYTTLFEDAWCDSCTVPEYVGSLPKQIGSSPGQIGSSPGHIGSFTVDNGLENQISKCAVKAGKCDANTDSISFSGILDATAGDLDNANEVRVTVNAVDMPAAYVARFNVLQGSVKKGKYASPRVKAAAKTDPKESFKLDTTKGKFTFVAKNIDLTGLSCPVSVEIAIGNYDAGVVMNEDIVNGKKPVPIQFMMGVKDIFIVDKVKVKFGKKTSSDSLSVKGVFTVEDVQAFQNGINNGDPIYVVLGRQTFPVYPGKSAKFDTCKCTFSINLKGLDIAEYGEVDFGIDAFGINLMSIDKIDLGPKSSYNLEELRLYDVLGLNWQYQSSYKVKGTGISDQGVETANISTGRGVVNGRSCYSSTYSAIAEWERFYWYTGIHDSVQLARWSGENEISDFEFNTNLQIAPKLMRVGQSFKSEPATFTGSLNVYVDDADVTITNLRGTVTSTCKLVGHEQVTVPKGTFNAVKVEQTYVVNGTMNVRLDGWDTTGKVSIKIKDTWWGVPGIGIVKGKPTMSAKVSAKGAGSLSLKVTETDELTDYND